MNCCSLSSAPTVNAIAFRVARQRHPEATTALILSGPFPGRQAQDWQTKLTYLKQAAIVPEFACPTTFKLNAIMEI